MRLGDIRQHWDFMRPKIEEMLAGSDERPEEIYADVVHDKASLYVTDDGFVVIKPYRCFHTAEMHGLVWVAWCSGGRAMERYEPVLIELARRAGLKRLVMHTQRRGFERALSPGWKVKRITHELRI